MTKRKITDTWELDVFETVDLDEFPKRVPGLGTQLESSVAGFPIAPEPLKQRATAACRAKTDEAGITSEALVRSYSDRRFSLACLYFDSRAPSGFHPAAPFPLARIAADAEGELSEALEVVLADLQDAPLKLPKRKDRDDYIRSVTEFKAKNATNLSASEPLVRRLDEVIERAPDFAEALRAKGVMHGVYGGDERNRVEGLDKAQRALVLDRRRTRTAKVFKEAGKARTFLVGGEGADFKTVAEIEGVGKPGDTFLIRAGGMLRVRGMRGVRYVAEGNAELGRGGDPAVIIADSEDVELEGFRIRHFTGESVRILNSRKVRIKACDFTNPFPVPAAQQMWPAGRQLFADEKSEDILIAGNVFRVAWVELGKAARVQVVNNTFLGSPLELAFRRGDVAKNNLFYGAGSWIDGKKLSRGDLEERFFANGLSGGAEKTMGEKFPELMEEITKRNHLLPPGFTDERVGNYTLRADSPYVRLGESGTYVGALPPGGAKAQSAARAPAVSSDDFR